MGKNQKKLTDIFPETGTNEFEIVEFSIGDIYYGITVANVREIIRVPEDIVDVPDSHASLEGAINLRGKIIPVVNLGRHLNSKTIFDKKESRIIVSEFNQGIIGFWVGSVARIYRVSRQQLEIPSDLIQSKGGYALALAKIEDRVLFLLDFEKITADISFGEEEQKTNRHNQGSRDEK